MGFPRQESWSGLPFPPPGDLPNPGMERSSFCLLHWQAGSLPLVPPGNPILRVCVCVSHLVMSNSAIPLTAALQAPLSVEYSRQEYWSEFPFPSPGDLTDPGIEPGSPALQQILYRLSHQGSP